MVRYFPPGIILEFTDADDNVDSKSIDLLNLSENSDIPYLVQQINEKEPLTVKYRTKIQKVIESKLFFEVFYCNFPLKFRINPSNGRKIK